MKVVFFTLLALTPSLTGYSFDGDRRPGVLASPEWSEHPNSQDLLRAEEMQKVHRFAESEETVMSPPESETKLRELPAQDAI